MERASYRRFRSNRAKSAKLCRQLLADLNPLELARRQDPYN
jgi:hypothetical protein